MKVCFCEASGLAARLNFGSRAWSRHWKGGRDISEGNAEEHIAGYGVYTKAMSFWRSGVNTSQLSQLT
jgi:hypothetical protein